MADTTVRNESAGGRTPSRKEGTKPAYEPPTILKKRSVARVTLFSGGGVGGGGLTAGG